MSIIDAYDQSEPLFTPEDFYGIHEKCGDACILTFSKHVQDKVLSEYTHEIVAQSGTANGKISIYRLTDSGVLFYLSPIGSAVAGTVLHEVHTLTGVTKFISFGSCGVLDERCREKIVVPTEAYRDEGFSYHLLPPSDYICVKNAEFVKETLAAMGIETIGGRTWTTDAIYRKTVDKIAKRTVVFVWRWSARGCRHCAIISGVIILRSFSREICCWTNGSAVVSETTWRSLLKSIVLIWRNR